MCDLFPLQRLGDYAQTYSGLTPARHCPHFYGGTIPWVKSGEVNSESIRVTEETLSEFGLRSSAVKWVKAGNPLVAMYGATAGKVGWLDVDAVTNQAVLAVVPRDGWNPKWLYWALCHSTPRMLNGLQGSGQPNLSKALINGLQLHVPPILEQASIVQILDTLNTVIHETEAIIAKLKVVKQGLLHDLLTRGIDANGELRPPQAEAPHLYKESPLGWIPVDWHIMRLENVIDLVSGQHIDAELCNVVGKGVPYFTGPSDFLGSTTIVTQYTNCPQIMCDQGDILITVKGSGCGKLAVAGVRACISRQLMAIKVPTRTLRYWFAVLQSREDAFNRMALGGNIPGISRIQILELLVAKPSKIEEMEAIGYRIESIANRLNSEELTLAKLKLEKSALMTDLLTGRVRVTPLLEPAP